MKQIEVGKTYIMVSPCNTDARWKLEVVSRTEKTITVTGDLPGGKQTKKLRISISPAGHYGMLEETCKPLGNYSLCPTLRATATTEDIKKHFRIWTQERRHQRRTARLVFTGFGHHRRLAPADL